MTPHYYRVMGTILGMFAVLAADAHGQRLLEVDGVELLGEAQLLQSGGGTCNVLESDTRYEEKQANHGAPMDIWRLDFTVRNGSGRWLDHLIARFQIESEWPECTNWDVPDAARLAMQYPSAMVEWGGSIGHIQESGRNVVSPGQTLTDTKLIIVLRGDAEPRFSNWSMDFDFAAAPPTAGTATGAPGTSATATAATPEQENIFWQSIAESTNPAMFEAYLGQFPHGVFRALAEARLAELRALVDNAAGAAPDRNPPRAATGDALSEDQPFRPDAQGSTCTGQAEGADCWKELTNDPGCHVWDDYYFADQTVTWTGACSDGLASGVGTLNWVGGGATFEASGTLREGKRTGYWVLRDADGGVHQGPYVNDERNGHWVIRHADGTVWEGAYMNGERDGDWILRLADGTVEVQMYSDGERIR